MSSPAQISFPRKLLYAALFTTFAATLILGLLEAGLRLGGYGYSPHFARRETLPGGETVWRENRWCTAPFFSAELVRRPQPFRLPLKKAPGTYRIFILGSSAAMGDPEPSFSIARMLEAMLATAYPAQHFEVVNAGITAINSHLVRGIAEDCAGLEPDLFIVYEGNNEVIGPFGPSGVFTPFLRNERAIRASVWLKSTRTGQLVSAAARLLTSGRGKPAEWGGMQMFLHQQIAASDPRLATVRDHFRANLLSIAEAAQAVSARTLLCTVLTNQRDFAPFLSQHRSGLSPEDLARWDMLVSSARAAERAGATAKAEESYRQALAIDDQYAELPFRLGRLVLQGGHRVAAQELFQRALDLDTLRFRTDSVINQAVRELGTSGVPGLEVLDLVSKLAAGSEGGVVGDELLYEHVHLTLRGTYEAAREMFGQVSADLARRRVLTSDFREPFTYEEARIRLGYTAHEQAMIALELVNRFRSPPFTEQADHAFRLHQWQQRVDTATTLLARPDALPALREIYQRAFTSAPNDWILARNAGAMFVARNSPAEAVPLLERAAKWIDDDIDTLVPLAWAYRALGHTGAANQVFARARSLEPAYPGLPPQSP